MATGKVYIRSGINPLTGRKGTAAELEYLKNLSQDEYNKFRQPYAPHLNPTMVPSDDPNLGANALNRPGQGTTLEVPNHTGHPAANTQGLGSNEINKPSTAPPLNIPKDTAHRDNEKPAVTDVFQTNEREKAEKETSIDDYLRGLGNVVEPNPLEGKADAGRQGDRYVNGKLTEYKKLDPGADSSRIKNTVGKSLKREGQARNIIIDARTSGLSEALAMPRIARAIGISRGKLDSIRIIGNDFDITREVTPLELDFPDK